MAKAVTLRQFSEENVDYDVEFFTSEVAEEVSRIHHPQQPPPGNSRLVPATLRRQLSSQMCVDGSIAFVCVFVDHTRWTVELNRTGHPECPIRINQIRTTDNRSPEPPTEKKIYEHLGTR